MKSNRGITIIVLVITIILLIIIATVSLYALLGDDGVLRENRNSEILHEIIAVEQVLSIQKSVQNLPKIQTTTIGTKVIGDLNLGGNNYGTDWYEITNKDIEEIKITRKYYIKWENNDITILVDPGVKKENGTTLYDKNDIIKELSSK